MAKVKVTEPEKCGMCILCDNVPGCCFNSRIVVREREVENL